MNLALEPISPKIKFWLVSFGMAIVFFFMDQLLPLGFAGGVPYISLVLVGLWSQSRKLIFGNAVLGTILTIAGAYLSQSAPDMSIAAFNRTLTIATIWLTTYFCLMNLKLSEEESRNNLLAEANNRLKKETAYMQLNRDIASFTNLSRSLNESITYSLERICRFMGWPIGHLYLLGENGQTLLPSEIWYMENESKYQALREATNQSQLSRGEGLPGRILALKKSQFIPDINSDPNFPRATLCSDIGVASGFGFPILVENMAVGVMEFFSEQPMDPEERLMEVMESIGILLGRAIERTRAENEKENYSNHLRRLYHKLDSIREEESKRIAREVHDNLGQLLTTLKMEMSMLDNRMPEKNENLKQSIDMMFGLIDDNIQVVKKISQELRPPVLDSTSLTEAINWQGNLFQKRTGTRFTLSTYPPEINLDTQRSTTLFRIFQECLTNITRHSGATQIHVDLIDEGSHLRMRVADNGKGITEDQIKSNDSLGILGMKERAQIWGGEVQISGSNNEGSMVSIKINKG